MFPVTFADVATTWGLFVDDFQAPPDTLLASLPLHATAPDDFAIHTNATAAELNAWLGGIRESIVRMQSRVR